MCTHCTANLAKQGADMFCRNFRFEKLLIFRYLQTQCSKPSSSSDCAYIIEQGALVKSALNIINILRVKWECVNAAA
jgi:hypothetical protein